MGFCCPITSSFVTVGVFNYNYKRKPSSVSVLNVHYASLLYKSMQIPTNSQLLLLKSSLVASPQDQAVPMTSSLWLVTQLVSHAPVVRPSLPILINHPNQKDPYYCFRATPDLHATKTDRQKEKEQHYCPSFLMSPHPIGVLEKALRSWWGDPWELLDG